MEVMRRGQGPGVLEIGFRGGTAWNRPGYLEAQVVFARDFSLKPTPVATIYADAPNGRE
jgi:hypothetical protein